ncbi:MAG: 4'-phosphopantetheinyl transferase superfamily protein [Ignavibacteria bacterium]
MSKQKINIIGNEVHVYRINISEQTNKISNLRKLLSNDETKKADRYRFAKDSNSYIISRGSIRKILSEYISIDADSINISYTEFGKPFIENSKINFNLSHSGDWCFIAVSLIKDIGIDIEKVRKIEDVLKIADRYFAINEYEHIKNFDSTEQINEFFRIWTLKEAFIKAIGEGLSFPLKNFSVISDKSDSPVLNLFENKDESELWKLDSLECQKGYNASLTVKADGIDLIYK